MDLFKTNMRLKKVTMGHKYSEHIVPTFKSITVIYIGEPNRDTISESIVCRQTVNSRIEIKRENNIY